jgi:hypothetical protein
MTSNRVRLLRAVARNAAIWAAAWGLAGGAIVTTLGMVHPASGVESLAERLGIALASGVLWGVRFGVAGAVIGTVFSALIRLGYRGRPVGAISPARFALLGAVAGAVGVPLFLQLMNVLSGDGPVAWSLVSSDALWAGVFGAAVAFGSIRLARRADALPSGLGPAALDPGHDATGQPQRPRTPSAARQSSDLPGGGHSR